MVDLSASSKVLADDPEEETERCLAQASWRQGVSGVLEYHGTLETTDYMAICITQKTTNTQPATLNLSHLSCRSLSISIITLSSLPPPPEHAQLSSFTTDAPNYPCSTS